MQLPMRLGLTLGALRHGGCGAAEACREAALPGRGEDVEEEGVPACASLLTTLGAAAGGCIAWG